ncbi:MAG: PQQ-like beta-propeller repeat protein, partial [Verrucomicrobia bacterium]|nr:PQQ-like beta-propeller repeat protein [Verrucomicrobiota bacterium]
SLSPIGGEGRGEGARRFMGSAPASIPPLSTSHSAGSASPSLAWLGLLLLCLSLPMGARAADWPQWRGPERNGHTAPGEKAVKTLPAQLKPVWKLAIGTGFSSPIVAGAKMIYLDAQNDHEVVHTVDTATGRELWQHELAAVFGDEWGSGPRSTPFADGDLLFAQSCNGEFRCLSLADGKLRWRTNFEDFGVKFLGGKAKEGTASRRGNNGSGVADQQRVYVPVGGKPGAAIVAFDKRTGQEAWRALDDESAYSSFVLATLAGVPQLVAFTADALVGLERATGRLLWRVPFHTDAKRHAATPVIVGDLVIVNSQTIGLVATRVIKEGVGCRASEAWANRALKINLSTPVPVDGFLYSQGCNHDYVCVEAATGKLIWSAPGFGKSNKDYCSTILVGRNLLVLAEELGLIPPTPMAASMCATGGNCSAFNWPSHRLAVETNWATKASPHAPDGLPLPSDGWFRERPRPGRV